MSKFKVGDKVKPTAAGFKKLCASCSDWNTNSGKNPDYLVITEVNDEPVYNKYHWNVMNKSGEKYTSCFGHGITDEDLELYYPTLGHVDAGMAYGTTAMHTQPPASNIATSGSSGSVTINADGYSYQYSGVGGVVITTTQPPVNNLTNKLMSTISIVKDLALKVSNPAEYARRKAGLHDSCGELTSDGKELIWQYLKGQFADKLATDAQAILDDKKDNE